MGRLCGRGFDYHQLHLEKKKHFLTKKVPSKFGFLEKNIYLCTVIKKRIKMDIKILDGEFRNTLYKNLVDAGYEKKEAQKIIGVKYHAALKADVMSKINQFVSDVDAEKYVDEETTSATIRDFSAGINELRKLKSIIS